MKQVSNQTNTLFNYFCDALVSNGKNYKNVFKVFYKHYKLNNSTNPNFDKCLESIKWLEKQLKKEIKYKDIIDEGLDHNDIYIQEISKSLKWALRCQK
jgi:hypothetical protein